MAHSWDERDDDERNTLKVTNRGYLLLSVTAIFILLLLLAIVGGIEQ